MIGRLTGSVQECTPGRALLDVGGVGYELYIPLSTFYAISVPGAAGSVSLHVHTHVREDTLQLFGFATQDERVVFEQLIGITGVGPKMALAILSGIGADELRHAVEEQDRERLQKIPGVGRKTAERLLLELRDRLRASAPPPAPAAGAPPIGPADAQDDAVSALVNLGYSQEAAQRATRRARARTDVGDDLQALLRAALKTLID